MAIKWTNEKYIAELAVKNPDVIALEEYVNAVTPIQHKCLKHNVIWNACPVNVLRGKGCFKCASEKIHDSKAKTNDEYISELANKNPNVIVLDDYKNANTPIRHKCLLHNVIWDVSPSDVLSGKGCCKCRSEKIHNALLKTHDEYVSELELKNPNLSVLDNYIDSRTPIRHKCLTHDVIWNITPSDALRGAGCPKCKSEKISNAIKLTNDEYVSRVAKLSPTIKVIGDYSDINTKIQHECTICGNKWMVRPGSILNGNGCPACAIRLISQNKKMKLEEYLIKLKDINHNIELIGEFKGTRVKARHKCVNCGYEWDVLPGNMLRGSGCPNCSKRLSSMARAMSLEDYVSRLKVVNPSIELIGEYKNSKTKSKFKCLVCGNEWSAQPGNVLSGTGCPKCIESSGERAVAKYLKWHGIEYERQKRFSDCRDVNPLPFDFYLPMYNIAIEYDGVQHTKPVEYFGGVKAFRLLAKHDNIKTEYCNSHGIKLLRISHTDDIQKSLNNFLFAT